MVWWDKETAPREAKKALACWGMAAFPRVPRPAAVVDDPA